MLGLLPQPKMQAAEAAIITLCDRLAHSTMLEDRRAAMLSLKGFAHDKRELVASNGLKGLINSLRQDKNDPETIRACLETLIILFVKASSVDNDLTELSRRARQKNKRYVSPLITSRNIQNDIVRGPVDDISLWLTDEFTHEDENVVALLDFVQSPDMFTSLYALQLLSAMVTNRPDAIKQSLFSVHHGISTLVMALESNYEMVRDETVLLLLNLTDNHVEFQKLVAFEGAFDKIFSIIDDQGGICYGGVTVENCLSLLSNLLQYNVSNQKLFSGTQGISKYALMIDTAEDTNWGDQATTNMTAALQLARLFVIPGGESTKLHQDTFAQSGVLMTVLKLAFGPITSLPIRIASLLTASSLIYENPLRQEELLGIDVPYYDLSLSLNIQMKPKIVPVYQALLNWALLLPSNYLFTLRAASQFCLSAAFEGNEAATTRFIDDQKAASDSAEAVTGMSSMGNIFHTLAEYNEDSTLNPFKVWFAAVIVMHMFKGSNAVKDHLRKIKIGDASLGQDELSVIQAVSGQMISSFDNEDPTVSLAYLMLLSVWLFDDVEAVNDFVSERTVVQQLITYVTTNNGGSGNVLVGSLATILLGIAYDFCPTAAPLPRPEFYHLLANTLGRDQYTLSLQRFRENVEFKDFDPSVIFAAPKGSNGLPRVYFDSEYISLIRDNMPRIQRAIDRDPTVEPSSRVSLDMYEELKMKLRSHELEMKELTDVKLQREELFLKKEAEFKVELERISASLKTLQTSHDETSDQLKTMRDNHGPLKSELETLKSEHEKLLKTHNENLDVSTSNARKLEETEAKLAKATHQVSQLTAAKDKAEDGVNKLTRELLQLTKNGNESQKGWKNLQSQVSELSHKLEITVKSETSAKSRVRELEENVAKLQGTNDKLVTKLRETAQLLENGEKAEAQLNETLESLESLRAAMEAGRHRIASLEKENKLIRAKLGSARGAPGHDQNGNVDPVTALLEEKITSLEAQLALAKAELDTESALDEELEEANKARNLLSNELAAAHAKITEYEQRSSTGPSGSNEDNDLETISLRAQVLELQAKLDESAAQSTDGAALSDIAAANDEIKSLKSKLADTEEKFARLETLSQRAAGSNSSPNASPSQGDDVNDAAIASVGTQTMPLSGARSLEIAELSNELAQLQSQVLEAKDELGHVQLTLEQARRELELSQNQTTWGAQSQDLAQVLEESFAPASRPSGGNEEKLTTSDLETPQAKLELESLRESFEELKKQSTLKALQSSEDIEALLLLLDDATEQKNAFKLQLQTLGQQVPNSDSEDNDSFLL